MTLKLNLLFAIILGGGWIFSRLFSRMKLPPVMGMVVFGILCSLTIKPFSPQVIWELSPFLKSFALIVILLRAGLGINRKTLDRVGATALLMAFLPCLFEGITLTLLIKHFFGFDWYISGLTAFMLAAVSPAVIVPSMLDLKQKGHNDVPTIIMAGASVDDVFAITFFSVFLGLAQSDAVNIYRTVISVPLSIFAGVASGMLLGFFLLSFFKKRYHTIRATEKALIVLVFCTLLVQVGDLLQFAALLGIMTAGFILLEKNEKVAHELALKFSKIWIFAEIILFVLIGFSLEISAALDAGIRGLAVISAGLLARSFGVILATMFSTLGWKERLFGVISFLPKATVQAALGSVALAAGFPEGNTILAIAVLSIVFTAPLGLFGIRFFAPRLLKQDISD